jgi:ArsR family transcriptional regulator, arsenate/arsenite/antimonite-responsive transcriptional repressor
MEVLSSNGILTCVDIVLDIDICQYAGMKKVSPCCPPVLHAPLTDAHAEGLAAAFKALADPARLRILSLIAAQPGAEACVCHLTEPIGLSQPTMTHHLQVLHAAGLLGREKRGAWVYYTILPERLEELRAALATRAPRRQAALATRAPRTQAARR